MTGKEKLLAFTALALLMTAGFPAMAQPDDNSSPPPSMGDERPMKMGDKDGRFGDGPDGPGGKDEQKRGAEMFAKTDTNGDGYLTKDELLESHKKRLDEMFAKADTDKDGKLSPEEMRKMHQDMRSKFREKFKDRMGKMKETRKDRKDDEGRVRDGEGPHGPKGDRPDWSSDE